MNKNNNFKFSLLVLGLALAQPQAVLAHGNDTATTYSNLTNLNTLSDIPDIEHRDLDAAPTLEEEAALILRVEQENLGINPNAINNRIQTRLRLPLGSEGQIGRWEPLQDWPVIGVFTSILHDGRVLMFDSVGDNATELYDDQTFTRASIWDPKTNTHKRIDSNTGYNLFCSGFSSLPDGRLFIAGGNADKQLNGLIETHTFNPLIDEWSRTQRMEYARWYPAVTALPNGEMLITGGGPATSEVREVDGSIRQLTNAAKSQWNNRDYPWLQTAPNGKAAFLGPAAELGYVDTAGTGAWQDTMLRDSDYRSYGSYAMYDIGKVLIAGGGFHILWNTKDTAVIVDLNDDTKRDTSRMNNSRRQHNLTVLADGTVLATGGISSNNSLVDLNNAVYEAELWNPNTEQWTRLAEEDRARQYHSTAIMLPDARVLSAGGGICGDCTEYLQRNAQIFTPPYLFRKDGSGELADRPVIGSAPDNLTYNKPFKVESKQWSSITKMALARLGSVTHSQNMEQRYIPLDFTKQGSMLVATSPLNANIAPPGHYMLFILDDMGVPSESKIVKIDNGIAVEQPQSEWENYALGQTATQSSNYNAQYSASNAVDGSTDGNILNGSMAHTKFTNQSWWQIDLGSVREIKQVSIFNRTDCCEKRLSNFHLLVSETPFISNGLTETLGQQGISEFYHEGIVDKETRIEVNKNGRYVRVQLAGKNFLQLAEVQVWGKPNSSVLTNIAPLASATASSENVSLGQTADKAIDGVVGGWPDATENEWATDGGREGQSLTLTWDREVSISQVILHDRPSFLDIIIGGTLKFDDGSTVSVGVLNNEGQETVVNLPSAKKTRSLTFTVKSVGWFTFNVGLAEIKVIGNY